MKDASEGREPWRKAVFPYIKKKKKGSGSPEPRDLRTASQKQLSRMGCSHPDSDSWKSSCVGHSWPPQDISIVLTSIPCYSRFFLLWFINYLYSKRRSRCNQCKSWVNPVNCKPIAETDCVSGAMMESRRGAKRWEKVVWGDRSLPWGLYGGFLQPLPSLSFDYWL